MRLILLTLGVFGSLLRHALSADCQTYTIRAGCYSSNQCGGTVVVSGGVTKTCSPYSVTGDSYASENNADGTCTFTACTGDQFTVSNCDVCSGDTYLRLFDASSVQVAVNDDYAGCGPSSACSSMSVNLECRSCACKPCSGLMPICESGLTTDVYYCNRCSSDSECMQQYPGSISCSPDGSCFYPAPSANPTPGPTRPTPVPTLATTNAPTNAFVSTETAGFFSIDYYNYTGSTSECETADAISTQSFPTAKCLVWNDSSNSIIQSVQAKWANNKLVQLRYSDPGCQVKVSESTTFDLSSMTLGTCYRGQKYGFQQGTTPPAPLADAVATAYYSQDASCSNSPYMLKYYYGYINTCVAGEYEGTSYSYKYVCDSNGIPTVKSYTGTKVCDNTPYEYVIPKSCDRIDYQLYGDNNPSSGVSEVFFCANKGATVGSLQALTAEPTAVPSPMPTLRPSAVPTARPTAKPTPAPSVFTVSGAVTTPGWVAVRQCSGTRLTQMTSYAIGYCFGLSNYDGGFKTTGGNAWLANSMTYQLFSMSSIKAVYFKSTDCTDENYYDSNTVVATYTAASFDDSCRKATYDGAIVSSLVGKESLLSYKNPSPDNLGVGVARYSPTDTTCQNPAVVTYDVFSCKQSETPKSSGSRVDTTVPVTSTKRVCATSSLYVETSYKSVNCLTTADTAVAKDLSDACVREQSDAFPNLMYTRSFCGNELVENSPTQAPTSKPSKSPTPAPFSSVPTHAPVLRSTPVIAPTLSPTAATYTVSIVFKLPGLDYNKDVKDAKVNGGLSKVLKALTKYALEQSGIDAMKVVISDPVFSTNPPTPSPTAAPTGGSRREMMAERKLSSAVDAILANHNYLEVTLSVSGSYAQMTAAAAKRNVAATPSAALQAAFQQNLESTFKEYALQEAAKQGMLEQDSGTIARLYQVYAAVSNKNFITSTLAVTQNQPTPAPVAAAPRPTLPPSIIYKTVTVDKGLKDDAIAGITIGGFVFVVGAVGLLTFLYVRKGAQLKEASGDKAKTKLGIADILPSKEQVAASLLKFFPQNNSVEVSDLSNRGLAMPVTLFYLFAFVGCLCYFTTITTTSLAGNEFLSISGTSSEQICSTVPNKITAEYEGDINGNWETNPLFSSNVSVFTLVLTGTSIDEDQYRTVMASFDTKLYDMGLRVAARDVAFGLLTWTTFGLQDKSSRMNFYSNMAANYILDGMSSWGVLWSREGQCNPNGATGSSSLQSTGKYLRLSYSDVSSGSDPCPSAFNPIADFQHVGSGSKDLNIDFDTRSILTAIAVNLGIIDIAHLNMVQKEVDTSSDFGFYYIDPFYDKMTPIFCLLKENQKYPELSSGQGNEVCFVIYKNLVLYPGMWSVQARREGENNIMEEFVDLCTCPEADSSVACQSVLMQISLLYWRSSASSALNAYKFGLKMKRTFLDSDPVNGDLSLNKFFFSSLPNQRYSQSSINGSTLPSFVDPSRDPQVLFDNICPDMGCAAFQFFLWLAHQDFFSVNEASVQYGILSDKKYYHAADDDGPSGFSTLINSNPSIYIPKLACENLFYKAQAIKRFVETPPTSLVQLFSACHMTQRAAFISAIGSSAGSASLYSQIVFSIVVGVILSVVNNSAYADKDKILSPAEKAQRKKEEEEKQMLLICEMVEELVKSEVEKINDVDQTIIVSNKFHELYRKKLQEAHEAAVEREKEKRMSLFALDDGSEGNKPADDVAGGDEKRPAGANGEFGFPDIYPNSDDVVREVKTADVADVNFCGVCVGAALRPKKQATACTIDDHATSGDDRFSANPGIQPASPLGESDGGLYV